MRTPVVQLAGHRRSQTALSEHHHSLLKVVRQSANCVDTMGRKPGGKESWAWKKAKQAERAALVPFIMAAFEVACVRPPACLDAFLCTLHVLTDVCSSRVLRMWPASPFLRPRASGGGRTQLSSALEQPMQRKAPGRVLGRRRKLRAMTLAHCRGDQSCQCPTWSTARAPCRA